MATAVREAVETEVTKVEHVPVIKLELNQDEANRLYALTGGVLIGGADELMGIRNALDDVGAVGWWHEYYKVGPGRFSWSALDRNC